jgi:hypothetical protein
VQGGVDSIELFEESALEEFIFEFGSETAGNTGSR